MLQAEEGGISRSEVSRSASPIPIASVEAQPEGAGAPASAAQLRWRTLIAVPIAALVAVGIHFLFSTKETPVETHSYALLYWEIVGVSIVLAIAQRFWSGLRRWMRHMCPIFTGAILLFGVWDVI